jgi:hypothetical protein
MRNHPMGIILWGIQGFVFVLFWDLVGLIPIKLIKGNRLYFAIRGGVSGFGASSLSIIISLLGLKADKVADSIMWGKLYFDLILYATGVVFLGIIIGLIMSNTHKEGGRS